MIRVLTILASACLVVGIALFVIDAEANVAPASALLLVSFALGALLGVRRGVLKARGFVSDARRFISGDIQHARLVEVGDPEGWFNPAVNVVLELEGEDGSKHRFDHDLPVPFPVAWSYRLGKRFKVPGLAGMDLTKLTAAELRRDGLDVSLTRGASAKQADADERGITA